jgi:small-conductance mechanosensitive channel
VGDLGTTLWGQLLAFNWAGLLRALIILGVGMMLARVVSRAAGRVLSLRLDLHQTTILRRVIFYIIVGLAIASALHQLGFRLGVLLGAAGILTVAIGFASQTSASNLISGLFLIAERPFQIGDFIQVANEATGEVLSIDLLSVKMRTRDNLFVRVPNETLVKAQVTNYSRFPIRRYDLMLGVAYREDLDRVREVLEAVADANPLCLEEPRPQIFFQGFERIFNRNTLVTAGTNLIAAAGILFLCFGVLLTIGFINAVHLFQHLIHFRCNFGIGLIGYLKAFIRKRIYNRRSRYVKFGCNFK